eukprot:759636-Alexandrium_andersonii.AAC.1
MSASLVGSEMCIRDRGAAKRRPKLFCRSALAHSTAPVWRRLRGASVSPVSYTHLTLPTICSV